jgi:phosphopantothenoylcysteine decarboxylase/phosphopantothenate--cysteine ligase
VSDALGNDDNQVVLYDDQGRHPLPRAAKTEVARAILEHVSRLMKEA